MKITRNMLYHLGLITLLGFTLLGGLIIVFIREEPFISIFFHGKVWYLQLAIGAGSGLGAGLMALILINLPFMKSIRNFFNELFSEMELKIQDVLFLSFCAGVGEEILFRGAIQHYLGIWLTSFVFVALHGYLNPKNWRLSVYGIFMLFVSSGLGYLYEYIGLISAMAAHFTIDVVLFMTVLMKKPDARIKKVDKDEIRFPESEEPSEEGSDEKRQD